MKKISDLLFYTGVIIIGSFLSFMVLILFPVGLFIWFIITGLNNALKRRSKNNGEMERVI